MMMQRRSKEQIRAILLYSLPSFAMAVSLVLGVFSKMFALLGINEQEDNIALISQYRKGEKGVIRILNLDCGAVGSPS